MANYFATARSNEFVVKDIDAFIEALTPYDIGIWVDDPAAKVVSIYSTDLDDSGWPRYQYDEATDDYLECDVATVIAPHLKEDCVAILFEVGAEKLRYLIGTAYAINAKGETLTMSLDEMFTAARKIGSDVRQW